MGFRYFGASNGVHGRSLIAASIRLRSDRQSTARCALLDLGHEDENDLSGRNCSRSQVPLLASHSL